MFKQLKRLAFAAAGTKSMYFDVNGATGTYYVRVKNLTSNTVSVVAVRKVHNAKKGHNNFADLFVNADFAAVAAAGTLSGAAGVALPLGIGAETWAVRENVGPAEQLRVTITTTGATTVEVSVHAG